MDANFTLKIRKRTFPQWLMIWIVVFPLLTGTLFDLLSLPSFIKYIADLAWLLALMIGATQKRWSVNKTTKPVLGLVLAFFLYVFLVYLFRYQSIWYFLWGIRNNFRYYVFFLGIILFFSRADIPTIFRLFDVCFWLNAVVTLLQFFVFGYRHDYLGGIFGVTIGCNAYSIVFLCIVVGYSLLRFMNKQETALVCLTKCGVSLAIAALAELKVFFIFFVMIAIMSSLFTSFSWKKVVLLLVGGLLLYIGASLLVGVFGSDEIFSLEQLWELATQDNYSSQDTVNRLSSIPTLAKTLIRDPSDRAFGLGLGNCDTATFDIVNTPFYQQYFYLRYSWFSCARLFLETGYIGLAIYLLFFVFCIVFIAKQIKSKTGNPIVCYLGIMTAVLCICLTFYNSALQTEAGYMCYLFLALPFVGEPVSVPVSSEKSSVRMELVG